MIFFYFKIQIQSKKVNIMQHIAQIATIATSRNKIYFCDFSEVTTMEFGWGHIFLLAKQMFHMSNEEIAKKLEAHPSTISRHINGIISEYYPKFSVYKFLFAPPDNERETHKQYYEKLKVALDSELFPEKYRKPHSGTYRKSIEYLLIEAAKAKTLAKKKRSLQIENSGDGKDDTSPQEKTVSAQLFSADITTPNGIEVPGKLFPVVETTSAEIEGEEYVALSELSESSELPELSEPKYYREYRQESFKQFEMYGVWDLEPLDPKLKEKWGAVCITDEFCKSIRDYGIVNFLEIAPSELLPMKKIVTEKNVVDRIRSAIRFVDYMEPAMDHMMINEKNEEIYNDIANFTTLLRRYLNLLRENSNNLDLFANEFILMLSGDTELERRAYEYYDELRSRLENLEKRLKIESERRQDND